MGFALIFLLITSAMFGLFLATDVVKVDCVFVKIQTKYICYFNICYLHSYYKTCYEKVAKIQE